MEYTRQEFGEDPASQEAKFDHNAQGLIAEAARLSKLKNTQVDPTSLAKREGDYKDGQIVDALRAAVLKGQGAVNPAQAVQAGPTESVELDPRLTTFKADFDADPTLQYKISWTEIRTRLLANEGHYLALAQAMEQGGQLFGVDEKGRPLISDRGDEPVMTGMTYKNTRDRVLYKHDKNDIAGKLIPGEDGQPQLTGYEMFGYTGDYDKSEEITQYEAHTGRKFVQNSKEWRSSWLESGENPGSPENPSWPRDVNSSPYVADSYVDRGGPQFERRSRGVRRLLRVKKAA